MTRPDPRARQEAHPPDSLAAHPLHPARRADRPDPIPLHPVPLPPRRRLLAWTATAWTWPALAWRALAAALALLGLMVARSFFPNSSPRAGNTLTLGPVSSFPPGAVDTRWRRRFGFWIVRHPAPDGADRLYALDATCTHLGCPLAYHTAEHAFVCPCHGSAFDLDGIPRNGPASQPLARLGIALDPAGQVVVDRADLHRGRPGEPLRSTGHVLILTRASSPNPTT